VIDDHRRPAYAHVHVWTPDKLRHVDALYRFNNCFLIPRASATEKCNYTKPTAGHTDHSSIRQRQWRRQGGRGEASPLWVDVQKLCNVCVCAFIVMELHRITRQMHCKAVEQRATLIHRQYRDWGTSYSRPPIDPYLTPPPLLQNPGGATGQRTTKQRTRVAHTLTARNCSTTRTHRDMSNEKKRKCFEERNKNMTPRILRTVYRYF